MLCGCEVSIRGCSPELISTLFMHFSCRVFVIRVRIGQVSGSVKADTKATAAGRAESSKKPSHNMAMTDD